MHPLLPAETWADWRAQLPQIQSCLQEWISARASDPAWYLAQCQILASATPSDRPLNLLFKALGLAARKLGKADLALSAAQLQAAQTARAGWDPSRWSVDQAARSGLIVCTLAHLPSMEACAALLEQIAEQSEIQEQIALYQGYALYPQHPLLLPRAREAVRNGMRPVFAAFALRNPWPLAMFDEAAWNQMAVKTFFLDLPLWPVQGLSARANPALSAILYDLLCERRSAGRAISAELWRMLALCPDARICAVLQDLAQQAAPGSALRAALARAVLESGAPELDALRARLAQEYGAAMQDGSLADWPALAPWQE
ncbi:EboA domain-containing protein [Massilia sp. W12]|uniref:EboA domain-containing protein n=1 Tax=Massilia sp. W12 TaxID=3126507 RepID=UPI0030D3C919